MHDPTIRYPTRAAAAVEISAAAAPESVRAHPRIAQLGRHAVQGFGGVHEDHHHHLIIHDLDDPEAASRRRGTL
jgi:hypothetical protein